MFKSINNEIGLIISILLYYKVIYFIVGLFTTRKFLLKKNEQNFKSVFTFVQLRVRMKLLKDMRSEDNEYCKVN